MFRNYGWERAKIQKESFTACTHTLGVCARLKEHKHGLNSAINRLWSGELFRFIIFFLFASFLWAYLPLLFFIPWAFFWHTCLFSFYLGDFFWAFASCFELASVFFTRNLFSARFLYQAPALNLYLSPTGGQMSLTVREIRGVFL